MSSLHYSYCIGNATISDIINETCSVLWDILQPLVLPSTLKRDDWYRISNDFSRLWNFPNCCGAIDGKHVLMTASSPETFLYTNLLVDYHNKN